MIKLRFRLLALLVLMLVSGVVVTNAQGDNKLINGGLEEDSFGPYLGRRGGTFPIYLPSGWNYWFAAPTSDRTNNGERTSIQPHPGTGPTPHGGARALNISCGYFTCTAAVYQTVNNIQAGTNVQASAWSQVKACNLGGGTSCGSAIESGSQTRIGIDPTGGSDPNNPAIVWSAWTTPHDQWLQQSASATATGTSVTVFLYSTQANISDLNKTYWDDVSLTGGGTGGAAVGLTPGATAVPPTATPPPYVAFVVPQGQQPDGSIIHTIQEGDTMDSIAYAYGTTRTAILALNNLQSASFIFPGQKLIVKGPTAPAEATAEATAEQSGGENVAGSAPTRAATTAPTTDSSEPVATEESAATDALATEEATTAPTDAPSTEATSAEPTEESPTGTPLPTRNPATAPVVVANSGALDPSATTAQVCVLLFDDANQNRIQENGENLLAGGVLSLLKGGEQAGTYTTDGAAEPHCFEELVSGDYVVSASAPEGYGLTTPDQLRVQLQPGSTINLIFGAAQGVQPVQPPTADASVALLPTPAPETAPSATNQLLSISGLVVFGLAAVVLVGGIGLAVLLRRR
ncbi:MAG: LysM peptidoglycan-binding domain-containing protein [Chloroflexi bacterium]|nr:LysM peptidoglycan-binding domain-containing protein [Chloroflexota bacterium]MCC6896107.1 LysM peptidoglycan-binding domain-containing protein [Anaerolineae bacterium]